MCLLQEGEGADVIAGAKRAAAQASQGAALFQRHSELAGTV